tara:strand:- start:230 stop:424 length:195 start_codon:yes stop_codon:yes gene_type:complete
MLPAVVLILFCIFGQLVIMTVIQLKDLKTQPRLGVLLATTILFILALWQTIEVWNVGMSNTFGY